jgi:hypothetical protein
MTGRHTPPDLLRAALCSALSKSALAHGAAGWVLAGPHDARSMSDNGWSVALRSP